MDGITCGLCERALLPDDRAIFLGVEKLLFHSACYETAVERLGPDRRRGRRLEDLIEAARDARST